MEWAGRGWLSDIRPILDMLTEKPDHPRAFMRLVRHWPSWEEARAEYGKIALPVLLLYGDHDWSRDAEREADRQAIPDSGIRVVKDAGHFLALDAPSAFVQAVVDVEEQCGAEAKRRGPV